MKQYSEDIIIKLLNIIATCDDGCFVCVGSIFEKMQSELPELIPLAREIFRKNIGYDYLKNEWVISDNKIQEG